MKIAIIGQGYVGYTLGSFAHKVGHNVIGIENNDKRLEELTVDCPYALSSNYEEISDCEVIVLALPTPLTEQGLPDLQYLIGACKEIRGNVKPGALIVNESTVFPGTLRSVIKVLIGEGYSYAVAPERIDPGNKEWNIENTPRLLGALNELDWSKASEFYSTICAKIIRVSSAEVAELAKLVENTFRMVNIALVNELSRLTTRTGISISEVINAASTKPFGYLPFFPSLGVGGHCIPIDPIYLSHGAELNGVKLDLIDCARSINLSMPKIVVEEIKKCLDGELKGKVIQISGIAYKEDIPDTRDSPSLEVLYSLRKQGAEVIWHDEIVRNWNSESSSPIKIVDFGVLAVNHSNVDLSLWANFQDKVIDVSSSRFSKWRKFP